MIKHNMSDQKKRLVAFIHPDLGIGGAERLVLDVAIALSNDGHEVEFVTNHFDKTHSFEELQQNKYPVYVIGDWIPRSVCGICQAVCAYLRMLYLIVVYLFFTSKEKKPDVYFVDQIPMAVPFIKWSGNKVVYYCHHPDLLASPRRGLLKKLYRLPINLLELHGTSRADVLLVNSKYTENVFRQTFPEITNEIKILYPTIASSYQVKVENRKEKKITELIPDISASINSIIFLSINRFHPAKKLELALNGLEALKQKVSLDKWNLVYLIMAGGFDPHSSINAKYFSKLVNIAQNKDISNKVIFLKSPSDDLKADLLLACDCLIYTPVNEHFGIVPLEAMIANKPVIACNSGGPCETVEHDVTGYLCDPTSDSLADSMSKMLDKIKNRKMGSLGKARQQKYFSHATFTLSVNEVIQDLVKLNGSEKSGEQNEAFKTENITNEALEVKDTKVVDTNVNQTIAANIENIQHTEFLSTADKNIKTVDYVSADEQIREGGGDKQITQDGESIKTEEGETKKEDVKTDSKS